MRFNNGIIVDQNFHVGFRPHHGGVSGRVLTVRLVAMALDPTGGGISVDAALLYITFPGA